MSDTFVKEAARSSEPTADSRRRAAKPGRPEAHKVAGEKIRVFVAAENRLLREALARVLCKGGCIEVRATDSTAPFHTAALVEANPDILLLTFRGTLDETFPATQQHAAPPPPYPL